MERYQVILAYDGSQFKGFQRQAKPRTVQGELEKALLRLGWQGKSILAAGRTDTGAHATGQVITFDMDWTHGNQELLKALNANLPIDVVARELRQVPMSFHPRYDASWRRYRYRVYCQRFREPLLEHYAWHVWPAVDENLLHKAAGLLEGTHDFGAFGTSPEPGGSTVRVVHQASWMKEGPCLVFEITAQAFLYHMVRRLVFTQVRVAQGKLAFERLEAAIATGMDVSSPGESARSPSDRMVHGLAPARGLILVEVSYPPGAFQLAEDKEITVQPVDSNNELKESV